MPDEAFEELAVRGTVRRTLRCVPKDSETWAARPSLRDGIILYFAGTISRDNPP